MPTPDLSPAVPEPGEVERLAALLQEADHEFYGPHGGYVPGEELRLARWLFAHGLTVARDAPSGLFSEIESHPDYQVASGHVYAKHGEGVCILCRLGRNAPSEAGWRAASLYALQRGLPILAADLKGILRVYVAAERPSEGSAAPSRAAWKAAVDAASPGLPNETQGNIETAIDLALRAYLAAERQAVRDPVVEAASSQSRGPTLADTSSPAASPSTPSTESRVMPRLQDWCDRHQRFYAVNDCPECAPAGRREPSEAAWKAALEAIGGVEAPTALAEDPSCIVHALRAAYAVDFPSAPEGA